MLPVLRSIQTAVGVVDHVPCSTASQSQISSSMLVPPRRGIVAKVIAEEAPFLEGRQGGAQDGTPLRAELADQPGSLLSG